MADAVKTLSYGIDVFLSKYFNIISRKENDSFFNFLYVWRYIFLYTGAIFTNMD